MAAARAKTAPTGSSQWIVAEKDQADQFVQQEAEEFSYSVRNELEWLNEHMAEIFSKGQMNFADVFKTPGKLRGKTPRTARKRDAVDNRQPLTDIFASNQQAAPASTKKNTFLEKVAHFQIAEDEENRLTYAPVSRGTSPQRAGKPNTDSGYHGITDDEADNRTEIATQSSQQSTVQKVPIRDDQPPPQRIKGDSARTSDETFMSAKSDFSHGNSREPLREISGDASTTTIQPAPVAEMEDEEMDDEVSDVSSPEKPLQRKSSFTFAALPAREPLTAKRSIGVRDSNVDAYNGRGSMFSRSHGPKGVPQNDEDDDEPKEKAEESRAPGKTASQLLHERINMLGKTKKSIPANVQASYPQLPSVDAEDFAPQVPAKDEAMFDAPVEDDDDDWIAPKSKPATMEPAKDSSPARPAFHQKSISTTNIPSPTRLNGTPGHQKASSIANLNIAFANNAGSTTPAGSPLSKRFNDGPISASKSKLWSALKSAKNIFASSASASAAAKLDAQPSNDVHASPTPKTASGLSEELMLDQPKEPSRAASTISASPSRKTRNSTESAKRREKELKAQQKVEDELEKAREKERKKAAKDQDAISKREQAEAEKREKEMQAASSEGYKDADMAPPPPPKSGLHAPGKLRAPGRLMRPTKVEPTSSKPAPVSIRVASQSQRLGQPTQSSFSKSQHGDMGPPPSKSSFRPNSSQSTTGRSSAAPNGARVKALEAAARKKEADEKAAEKKAEQKRELERKRAAKQEDERRAEEERKAAEQQRLQEARQAAQRKAEQQAADARRREQERMEQARQQAEAQKAKAAHELAEAIKRERAQGPPPYPRSDVGGTLRQLTKNTAGDQSARPTIQPNPAKPAKRMFQPEDEEPQQAPQRPGVQRGPPSYQQNNAKRRKTEEEERDEKHSVMAPPKRPSNMRKESTVSKFGHGYQHAPAPAAHHPASMFKSTVTSQHQMQHPSKPMHPSQTVQMSNARIPFADNTNPPQQMAPQHPAYAQHHSVPDPNHLQPNKYKTPARPAYQPTAQKSAKSSPLFHHGDAIQLPEIQTDSEEEDSDSEDAANGGFRAPSWVASPALRELLTQQQTVDPESVFGPIAELKMDEVFRNGKNAERLKRFRDRGSSAMWIESGDAVTSAEKRRDMEGRERVAREGGWRFEPAH